MKRNKARGWTKPFREFFSILLGVSWLKFVFNLALKYFAWCALFAAALVLLEIVDPFDKKKRPKRVQCPTANQQHEINNIHTTVYPVDKLLKG